MIITFQGRDLETFKPLEDNSDVLSNYRNAWERFKTEQAKSFPRNEIHEKTQRKVVTISNSFVALAKAIESNEAKPNMYATWHSLLHHLATYDLTSGDREAAAYGAIPCVWPSILNHAYNANRGDVDLKPSFIAYTVPAKQVVTKELQQPQESNIAAMTPPMPSSAVDPMRTISASEAHIADDTQDDRHTSNNLLQSFAAQHAELQNLHKLHSLPDDTHIFDNFPPNWSVLPMPVVIVAEEHELVPMMTSVVLARRFINVYAPVVGLKIDGHKCYLVIAQVAENHVAAVGPKQESIEIDFFMTPKDRNSGFGILDLAEESKGDLRALILFLAGMKEQFEDIDRFFPLDPNTQNAWRSFCIGRVVPGTEALVSESPAGRYSSSVFASIPDLTEQWMLQRKVFTMATYVPGAQTPAQPEPFYPSDAPGMALQYNETTNYAWHSEWTAKAKGFPDIEGAEDDALYPLWTEAWEEKEAVVKRMAKNASCTSGTPKLHTLARNHEEILRRKMPAILLNVCAMRAFGARVPLALESETREIWDDFIKLFCIKSYNELTCDSSLHERVLRYPRNTLEESLRNGELGWADDLKSRAAKWCDANNSALIDFGHVLARPEHSVTSGDSEDSEYYGNISRALTEAYWDGRQQTLSLGIPTKQQGLDIDEAKVDAFRRKVQEAEQREPAAGKCDLLLYATGVLQHEEPDIVRLTNFAHAVENIKLVKVKYNTAVGSPSQNVTKPASKAQGKVSPLTSSQWSPARRAVEGEASAQKAKAAAASQPQQRGGRPVTSKHEFRFLLPQLVVEHKRPDAAEQKGLNQTRMYCASTVAFLQEIGIVRHPVFALATHGTTGSLVMGWTSQRRSESNGGTDDSIFIFERCVARFDLCKPFQAIHFAMVLLKIDEMQDKLEAAFRSNDCQQYLKRKLLDSDYKGWAVSRTVESNDPEVDDMAQGFGRMNM